jgi:Do/DeqQ family serine protease
MKQHVIKTLRWFLIGFCIVIAAPFILGKMNFYSPLQAESIAEPSTNEQGQVRTPPAGFQFFSYADAVEKAAPAVVSIKTTKEVAISTHPFMQDPFFRQFFGDPNMMEPDSREQQGLGSGVIVSEKGHILTNNHVIKGADTVTVTLKDGRTGEAKLIGSDPDTDLAVLKVSLDKLPIISLGVSQHLRPGDVVLAIGNPFGFDQTVTQGIISATERTGFEMGNLSNLIQTDAAINPGNSGGALIDMSGRLIGINTAIYSRSGGHQGIGFAVPIDQANAIMQQLISGKKITRGWLGVMLQNLNPEMREQLSYKDDEGVYVRAITQGSPAQKSGLMPGDIIRKINNKPVKDVTKATALVAGLKAGENYPLEIQRNNDILTFTVKLGERKALQEPVSKK